MFMQFANWEFFFQHYNFNACKPSCSRFFFGVGGFKGLRPLPPTPEKNLEQLGLQALKL